MDRVPVLKVTHPSSEIAFSAPEGNVKLIYEQSNDSYLRGWGIIVNGHGIIGDYIKNTHRVASYDMDTRADGSPMTLGESIAFAEQILSYYQEQYGWEFAPYVFRAYSRRYKATDKGQGFVPDLSQPVDDTGYYILKFNQAFYAIGQTKLPLIAGVIGLVINPVACHFMVAVGVGPLSLSLAYSFTNICQMIILAITYCRRKELAPYGIVRFLIKAAVCVAVMALVVFVLDRFLPAQGGKITQLLIISIKGAVAVVVYFGMAVLLRMQEATEWINKFKSKVFKKTAAKKA